MGQSHKPSQQFVLEHWQKISKQFGGFVPSKKLKAENAENQKVEIEENENGKEEDVGMMQLDIGDIMNMNGMNDADENEENQELDAFVAEDEDDDDNMDDDDEEEEDTELVLKRERIRIA